MKRFAIKRPGDERAAYLYYDSIEEARARWEGFEVEEYTDESHVQYVEKSRAPDISSGKIRGTAKFTSLKSRWDVFW